jgi:hypothetical protein
MLSMRRQIASIVAEQRTAKARPPPLRKAASSESNHSSGESHGPGGAQDERTALAHQGRGIAEQ